MDRKYWDEKAGNYNDEIFSSLNEDKNGVIRKAICRFASRKSAAADFGCGTGHYVPYLASKFGRVHACDLPPLLIEKAKKRRVKKAEFSVVDLSRAASGCQTRPLG